MGPVNWLAVVLGAVAFFAVGALWYTVLFGKIWQRESGLSEEQIKSGNPAMIFGLCFVAEPVVASMFGHNIARTQPPTHVI